MPSEPANNDTVCPVCWESVHSDKPVGVTTGCGHIWHQECYRSWQRKGEYIYESSTTLSGAASQSQSQSSSSKSNSNNKDRKKRYTLNSHLNCLICQQPTQSFVDLFIRLPRLTTSINHRRDLVLKLEQEFNTVSRRTQSSLEKEIARRNFEQTWLQEERQLTLAARKRAEKRHQDAIQKLEDDFKQLKVNYERKSKSMEARLQRRRQRRSSSQNTNTSTSLGGSLQPPGTLQFNPNEQQTNTNDDMDQSLSFSALESLSVNDTTAVENEGESFVLDNNNNNNNNNNESTTTPAQSDGTTTIRMDGEDQQTPPLSELATLANDDDDDDEGVDNSINTESSSFRSPSCLGVATVSNETNAMSWQEEGEQEEEEEQPRSLLAWGGDEEATATTSNSAVSPSNVVVPDQTTSISTPTFAALPPIGVASTWDDETTTEASSPTPPPSRSTRATCRSSKDTIFPPKDPPPSSLSSSASSRPTPRFPVNTSRSRISKDANFPPMAATANAAANAATVDKEDSKLPAIDATMQTTDTDTDMLQQQQQQRETTDEEERKPSASRKRKVSLKTSTISDSSSTHDIATAATTATTTTTGKSNSDGEDKNEVWDDAATMVSTTASIISAAEYERRRLEAETAYYQHQAELVERELHQAEIELERDEEALRQREQRIRLERSRLEESFTSIQRRVEESKQEARDRQKLIIMEQKFIKYKIARCKEEERFEQEMEHLKQDEIQIQERQRREQQRQETEKLRLRKELNQLVKVMNRLENAKKLVKLAEEQEQSCSASQSHETCVICFEPLVNDDNELGVVECGHAFHSQCWDRWEKSKRRHGSNSVPCPLCNVPINTVCVTMRFGSAIYHNNSNSSSSIQSSLDKHFQEEEYRWQRRRLTDFGYAPGEASS